MNLPNGCELSVLACPGGQARGPQAKVSGRGSTYRWIERASRLHFALASAAASTVRSSEFLASPFLARCSPECQVLPSRNLQPQDNLQSLNYGILFANI